MARKDAYHSFHEETASVDELRAIQSERLRAAIRHAFDRNSAQRKRLEDACIGPDDIRDVDDLRKIPLTDKAFLHAHYPFGLACAPKNEILEMHMSAGSTGTPVVVPYTQADLDQWALCMARCLRMAGAQPADVIQITPAFGLFNGGFGLYRGAEQLGLFVLPTGAGNTTRQVKLAKDFGTRIITGVVSYAARLMEALDEMEETLPDLEIGVFGAEVFSDAMKRKIAKRLGIEVFDIYGVSETGGVGTGMDCRAHCGIHIWEDQYIIEIVDPKSGEPVPDGVSGELVVTALTREALPVFRFKTGDVTRIVSRERCACGRTHARIAPISGRTDDMVLVKGLGFFPRDIEDALMDIPGVGPNFQIVVSENHGINDLKINVEASSDVTENSVRKAIRNALGFGPNIELFSKGTLRIKEGAEKHIPIPRSPEKN